MEKLRGKPRRVSVSKSPGASCRSSHPKQIWKGRPRHVHELIQLCHTRFFCSAWIERVACSAQRLWPAQGLRWTMSWKQTEMRKDLSYELSFLTTTFTLPHSKTLLWLIINLFWFEFAFGVFDCHLSIFTALNIDLRTSDAELVLSARTAVGERQLKKAADSLTHDS